MFGSIVRAVSSHKQVVIAGVALAVLVGYLSPLPNAIGQAFFPGQLPTVNVNTPNAYVNIFDRQVHVSTPGANIDILLHQAGL
jgi:hypothetical protein